MPELAAKSPGTAFEKRVMRSTEFGDQRVLQVLEELMLLPFATLDELVAATGWLPHTTRAALTGLRKKGHAIERGKRGDVSCYTLATETVAA